MQDRVFGIVAGGKNREYVQCIPRVLNSVNLIIMLYWSSS